ncbi:MAG TPA: hypothetical protein VJM83_04530, partial [Nitrospirota bacterium]|nr:hypothetical protein [Nitrospirota bacterium]
AQYNNQPFSRLSGGDTVTCVTCHNPMRKPEDYGRVWEMTTTDDRTTYRLQRGAWDAYGYLEPKVYRDASLWNGPTYSKSRKAYLVDPSEYAYDEGAGTVTFAQAQPSSAYVYVTLEYPYLRASSQDNRLCADCHTETTHRGGNCLTCHETHGRLNAKTVRAKVRTPDHSERDVSFRGYTGAHSFADGDGARDGICEVCHTQTMYYRQDGTGFANHSGGVNQDGKDCTACHSHANGFSR